MEKIRYSCQSHLEQLRERMNSAHPAGCKFENDLCVYVCGSLGRLEMEKPSDLDLFFITMREHEGANSESFTNIDKHLFFSRLYDINADLRYKSPSKGGKYWEFISRSNLLDIGSNQEDYNNSFTARMLLILESKPVYNEKAYAQLVCDTIQRYFVDYPDHENNFYPLFLMNDILRYWYTLTMNYEYRRDGKDSEIEKSWKMLKLKYSKLITCFSMLACLYKTKISPEYVVDCVYLTPFERLQMLASENASLNTVVNEIVVEYKWFLSLKEFDSSWWTAEQNKVDAKHNADKFHKLVVHGLMRIVSESNLELRDKSDIY